MVETLLHQFVEKKNLWEILERDPAQLIFTCSKLTIETLEKGLNML